jgi:hypothetical protein
MSHRFTSASEHVAGQRPQNGKRVQPLLWNKRINKHSFLGNGWVKTFPRQRILMQRSSCCWTITMETVFSIWSVPRCYKQDSLKPCGGGFEYLHRDPASRRRRRKGKSQIWDSKIWSRVSNNSNPRKTTLARTSSIYKIQTRPLVREGAPEKIDHNCQNVTNIWSWAPDGARHQDLLIDWRQSQCNFDLTLT